MLSGRGRCAQATRFRNPNSTPAELQAYLKTLSGLAVVRLNSKNAYYKGAMGRDIPNMLNPDAAQSLRNLGHGAEVDKLMRPTGATMKVPGSDGQLHWSDGKRDLGIAQSVRE